MNCHINVSFLTLPGSFIRKYMIAEVAELVDALDSKFWPIL
jgi:hypothetical protein